MTTQTIWKNGDFIDWHMATTHVLTHGLHYGSSVFEGIRCYKTKKGPAVFKLKEHIERLFYSAKQLGMHMPYSIDAICQAVVETLKKNQCDEAYIRPLAYYGYGSMKVTPSTDLPVDIIIATWPWKDYLPEKTVDIAISPYIRIHPKSTVADAKIGGHYVNSILAGLAIRESNYHEALLLDSAGFVAEGSAENIFIVKNETIITPKTGTILAGITRNTVMEIAKTLGLKTIEKNITPDDIYTADEAFFSGTAVEITPIRSLNDQVIGKGAIGCVTEKIKQQYDRIIHGENLAFHHALTFVESHKNKEDAA